MVFNPSVFYCSMKEKKRTEHGRDIFLGTVAVCSSRRAYMLFGRPGDMKQCLSQH